MKKRMKHTISTQESVEAFRTDADEPITNVPTLSIYTRSWGTVINLYWAVWEKISITIQNYYHHTKFVISKRSIKLLGEVEIGNYTNL